MKAQFVQLKKDGPVKLDGSVNRAIEMARNRLLLLSCIFTLAFTLAGARLIDVAVLRGLGEPVIVAESVKSKLKTGRANILDRNGVLLATSLSVASLYADPKEVIDPFSTIQSLSRVLSNVDKEMLVRKLSEKKRFVWIKRGITPGQQSKINALGLPGLHFQKEDRRFYPQRSLSAHVVGFSGTDAAGLAGVEKRFDGRLRDGSDSMELSIDIRVQHILKEEISKQIENFNAIGGAGVFIDVNSGEVLGMVSLPDFDPNAINSATSDSRFNRATLGVYEMGSTFKIFNTALALETGTATMLSGYDATKPIHYARFTINDFHPQKRWLSVPEIFQYSSNIGSAKMALDFGAATQKKFMKKLGFLNRLPIELPERGRPMYPSPWQKISTMTIAYGHGIAVSPMHLVSAVAAVVNGGILWPVTLLKKNEGSQNIGKQILSAKTSKNMRKMLRLVVENGTGRNAAATGYWVGGKTGTADKQSPTGAYAKASRLSSFVAAFPIHNPKYAVLVMVDEPKGNKKSFGYATGGWVAAPAVRQIIKRASPILGLLPIDNNSPQIKQLLEINIPQQKHGNRLASF
jgi:cell division protein FtsI (penicillin-binding protein 3)